MVKLTFSSFALTSLMAFLPPLTPLDVLVLYWQQVRFPGPCRPGGPWRPGDPLRPGGPSAPGGPWEPLYPCSPLGPMRPCIPLTPGEPGGPAGPAGPDCLVTLLIWHFQRKNGIIQLLPLHFKAVPLQQPRDPFCLTFALGWQGNVRFCIHIKFYTHLISLVQSIGSLEFFLGHSLALLHLII